ncbi:hypothetical protein HDV03_000081 [Kappamyces sp. JEL0829]|nr:hypothetical protein HDV03_000081 [Kappamyces sp. JEL0829]
MVTSISLHNPAFDFVKKLNQDYVFLPPYHELQEPRNSPLKKVYSSDVQNLFSPAQAFLSLLNSNTQFQERRSQLVRRAELESDGDELESCASMESGGWEEAGAEPSGVLDMQLLASRQVAACVPRLGSSPAGYSSTLHDALLCRSNAALVADAVSRSMMIRELCFQ